MIIHVPGWLSPEGNSVLDRPGEAWQRIVTHGNVGRVLPDSGGMREAGLLGLNPASVQLSPGVLIVAALGLEPPARSVHLAVSPLVLEGDTLRFPQTTMTSEERTELALVAKRLDTRRLTFLNGPSMMHGLVWEDGSVDLGTTPPERALDYRSALPQGDGEPMLRRWIDDSINMLREATFNRQRAEEGIERIEVLWPWGHGFRTPAPNLPLHYGTPIRCHSGSWRLQGLARLTGVAHADPSLFGHGTKTRLSAILEPFDGVQVMAVDAFEEFNVKDHEPERIWLTEELERLVWTPLSDRESLNMTVIAGSDNGGLVLTYDSRRQQENVVPFDERALDDRALKAMSTHEWVHEALSDAETLP